MLFPGALGACGALWGGLDQPGTATAGKFAGASLDPSHLETFFKSHAEESADIYLIAPRIPPGLANESWLVAYGSWLIRNSVFVIPPLTL